MKIPHIFIPDKSLDQETEHLIGAYREAPLEELRHNEYEIIHGKLTNLQRVENLERIALGLVNDTLNNTIKWEETEVDKNVFTRGYKAKAVIRTYKKEPLTVPVSFFISESKNLGKWGYFYLGNETSLCLNSFAGNKNMTKLLCEYFDYK